MLGINIFLIIIIIFIWVIIDELLLNPLSKSSRDAKKILKDIRIKTALKIAKKEEKTSALKENKGKYYIFQYDEWYIRIEKNFTILRKYNIDWHLLSIDYINAEEDYEKECSSMLSKLEERIKVYEKTWEKAIVNIKKVEEINEEKKLLQIKK